MRKINLFLMVCALFAFCVAPVNAQSAQTVLRVLDRGGAEVSEVVDGNNLRLSVKLSVAPAAAAQVSFVLEGWEAPVAMCSLAAGATACTSESFAALGWFWGTDGNPQPERVLRARLGEQDLPGGLTLKIRPRPVVMAHGFNSNWETWKPYLGADGYLAAIGLQGFAVGDGQAPGVMNTGSLDNPSAKTNSIAQNAAILGEYITEVQKQTGAEKVDLLVHSMGGMITRYYLDRVMKNENVAQVIFLGTPMAGSACIYPLASLGFLLPASLEILPAHMQNIFNQQIVRRHGVPFHMVAGTLLIDPLTSPCTAAPSDTVVGLDSATAIVLDDVQVLPMFHGDLTADRRVFDDNVKHLLQATPDSFAPRPDLVAPSVSSSVEQFSRAYNGHLNPGESTEVTINIDPNVSLANFSLFDSSRTLDIEVRGASGNVIQLDASKNGLMKIDDPETMFYLGYGFKQPKPGKWVVKLMTSEKTPAQGADYAINARFTGGATLSASSNPTIPGPGQSVTVSARLQVDGSTLAIDTATALIRKPDGIQESLALTAQGEQYSLVYTPTQTGLHSVQVILSGKNADGFAIDRAAFLAFEVQPGLVEIDRARLIALVMGVLLIVLIVVWIISRRKRA